MPEDTGKKWDDSLISMGLGALVVVVSGILLFNYFNNQTPKLLKNQGQKSISVSSSMPYVSGSAPTSATSSAKAVAQVLSPSPKVSATAKATATSKPTATPKPTVTPKATATVAPTTQATVKPSETPQASAIAQASTSPSTDTKTLPAAYTVQAGDSLWSVSQKFYGTGYEWKKIASANNISGSYGISKGQVLTVPKVEMISATSTDKSQIAQASPAASAHVSPTPAVGGSAVNAPANTAAPQGAITYTVVHGDSLWSIAQAKCNNAYAWSSIAKQNKLVHPSTIHAGNTFTFTCQ